MVTRTSVGGVELGLDGRVAWLTVSIAGMSASPVTPAENALTSLP